MTTKTRVKKVKKKTSDVDLSKYVNLETGEIMSSEVDGSASIVVQEDTGMSLVNSNDFAIIDTDAVKYLFEVLNDIDFGRLLKMSLTTKTPFNILFNHNVPHSNKSLQKYLAMNSESGFFRFVKRLMKLGIIYQIKGKIYGEVRVVYMLNPFLSRKRKVFDNKVFEIFTEFKDK